MRLILSLAVLGLIVLLLSAKGCDPFAHAPSLGPQNVVNSGRAMVTTMVDFGKRAVENGKHNLKGTKPSSTTPQSLRAVSGEPVITRYLQNRSREIVTYTFGGWEKTLQPGDELPIQVAADANGKYPNVVVIEAYLHTSNQHGTLEYYPASGHVVVTRR